MFYLMKKDNFGRVWTIILAAILAVAVFPSSRVGAAGSAAPACGAGDHGLLRPLQARFAADNVALSFKDIDFLSASTGRAAGPGYLIGTSDGGCSFQVIYQGQWQFADIDFPDNVYGWALASMESTTGRYLLRTVDGGSHWKRVDGLPLTINRIEFVDRNRGFAYDWASAYYTGDGGKRWSRLPLPANTRGAVFASRSEGYASVVVSGSGYRVMKTVDGGRHWRTVLTASYRYPFYTEIRTRGKQVWAVLYGGTGMSQTSYSLYASADSGQSWSRIIAEETAGGGAAPGVGPARDEVGPAGGKPGNLSLTADGAAFLLGYSPAGEKIGVGRSGDGGKTWSNRPAIPGYDGLISFASATAGWLAASDPDGWSLYATTDGGTSWSKKLTFPKK